MYVQNKDALVHFADKVNIIVDTILENVNTNTISKTKLLQLLVGNILKNEQEEIKTIIMD